MILKVISGPKAGLTSPLLDGLSIGRKQTQIALDDPKSSNLHAIIENQNDQFVIVDQKSRNGIKFQGKKVDRLVLEPGIEFTIGGSVLRVEASTNKKFTEKNTIESKKPNLTESANVEPQADIQNESLEIEPPHWSEVIRTFVEDHSALLKNKNKNVTAFKNLVELKILRGVQAGKSWTLGYGPRIAGRSSLDIQIFDKQAVDVCFELHPLAEGCEFKTNAPNKVLLDGKKQKSKVLTGGEIITIGVTELQVGFIYE